MCARLKKILETCGFSIKIEQGASLHDRGRQGDLMVENWTPGVDTYIDVSVIDPTGQNWRPHLVNCGVGESARLKEAEKRQHCANHFLVADKRHQFSPFIVETQGGVGETALKLIKEMLKKKKELNLRATSLYVKQAEVTRGEIVKKIVF